MSTSLLYHTQGIRDFKHVEFRFHDGIVEEKIVRKDFECPHCHSWNVSTYKRSTRVVTALPYGSKPHWLKFDVHTIYCHECHRQTPERIPFLSTPKSRITRQLERTLVEYRSSMSILAMVNYFGVRWHTIRDVLVRFLSREYGRISLDGVTAIGIDEIMVGHRPSGGLDYKTIVRDLATGAVLWVGDGKGLEALDGFAELLSSSKAEIRHVTMDMGHAFTSWVRIHLPKATIVYDHFHVVKLMNDAKAMPTIPYEIGAYYVFDRGYNSFVELARINRLEAFFVVRAKQNLQFKCLKWKRRLPENVLTDAEIQLTEIASQKKYPRKLRIVRFHDEDQNRDFAFITNATAISPLQVANLYKNRWQIELFFKWLKQHLKIKKFWGTTENAVRIQIGAAITAYCLVAIAQKKLQSKRTTYELLQILSASLMDKTPLKDLFEKTEIADSTTSQTPFLPGFDF